MKKILVMGWVLFAAATVFAQGPISFEEETYDFGEVKEEDGPIKHTFQFVNGGDKPIKILAVKASCGCTTPGWSKEEIVPSDSGFVTAQYNPANRPGRFKKSLRVTYDYGAGSTTKILYIEGTVEPKPRTIEDELSTEIGDLRIKYKSLNMGKVTTEEPKTKTFDVYNSGDSAFTWLNRKADLPRHITVAYEPETLEPKEPGQILVTYDAEAKDDLGFVSDNIKLYSSENKSAEKELVVMATIEEYFPPMSEEELAEAPKLIFNETQHDFGEVKEGDILETTFQLTNPGKQKLAIRKIKANCSCTETELADTKIKPGETIDLMVRFDTSGRRGRQYKTVTVFSNDPTAPSQMIMVKAEVH